MKKLLIIVILLWSQKLMAQTTYAVLVGVADYKNGDYDSGDLRWADRDARKMFTFLNPSKGDNVVLLLNRKATKSAIKAALQRTLLRAGPKDKIIFYFSGHGSPGAFAPYDIGNSPSGLLYRTEILDVFKRSKAGIKIVIADACFSGSISVPQTGTGEAREEKVLLMLSSRKTQTSIEHSGPRGGLFTYVLLKGLEGNADRGKKDGKVTAGELFLYTKEWLGALTNNEQTPVFHGRFPDGWVLSVY